MDKITAPVHKMSDIKGDVIFARIVDANGRELKASETIALINIALDPPKCPHCGKKGEYGTSNNAMTADEQIEESQND